MIDGVSLPESMDAEKQVLSAQRKDESPELILQYGGVPEDGQLDRRVLKGERGVGASNARKGNRTIADHF